ncbi:MAG: cyclic nucleotide-binding domain-containing protein [Magnetococcus sp. DMHC-6]
MITKLLGEIPFFWEFTQEEREIFAQNDSFFANYLPGEELICEGDTDDALFIVIQGQVKVNKNDNPGKVLAILGPGTILGEISFLTRRTRSSNVTAVDAVVAFKMDSSTIEKSHLNPNLYNKIRERLISILADRLENMNQALIHQKEINHTLSQALRAQIMNSGSKN